MKTHRAIAFSIAITLIITSFPFFVHASPALSISVLMGKPSYQLGETIGAYVNLTSNGSSIEDGLVALQVDDPSGQLKVIRTLQTDVAPILGKINITDAYTCDQYGNPWDTFEKGDLMYFKVTYENISPETLKVLITVNLYDSQGVALGTELVLGQVKSGTSAAWGPKSFPIPEWASYGSAMMYVGAYTSFPKEGGYAYCSEVSDPFEITVTGGSSLGSAQAQTQQTTTGTYSLNFGLPSNAMHSDPYGVYVSSSYNGEEATDHTTFIFGTTVSVEPSSVDWTYRDHAPGDTFTINISVTNVANLWVWQSGMIFNPDVLECLSYEKGDFLSQGGFTIWMPGTIDNVNGIISYASESATVDPVNGSGTLGTLTFRVKDYGTSTLHLGPDPVAENVLLINPDMQPIPFAVEDGYFELTANQPPVASFTFSPIIPKRGETVTFNASASYDPDGIILSYEWNFGDGTIEFYNAPEGVIVQHSYTKAGIYHMNLTVTDDGVPTKNATSTTVISVLPVLIHDIAIKNVTAYPAEVTKPDPVYVNVTVVNEGDYSETFNVTTYYNGNLIETRTDVALEPGTNKTITFTWNTSLVPAGDYTVSAEVSIVPGETDTDDNTYPDGTITILMPPEAPIASFTYSPSQPIVAETVTFNASDSYDPNGNIISWDWDFGDGTLGSSEIVTHTYTTARDYTVILTVTDNETLTDSLARTITVRGYPAASFTYTPSAPLIGETVTFDASQSIPDGGTIVSWDWDFGDGTTASGIIVTHAYTMFGTYTVNLTVTDSQDLTDSFTDTLTVYAPPNAFFTYSPKTPLAGETVTFNASASYDPEGGSLTYEWDFGDGNTGTGVTATHMYTTAGTYTVTLTVTDSDQLTDTKTVDVTLLVHDIAITSVSASPDTVKVGQPISITAIVTNEGNETETFDVTIYYDDAEIGTLSVTDLASGTSQWKVFSWDTSDVSGGTYTIKAVATTVPGETDTGDNTYVDGTVTIEKLSSTITLSADPKNLTVDSTTTLSGSITPTRVGVTVTIEYRPSGGTWAQLTTLTTDSNGDYSYTWTPETAGTYEVKASWEGDEHTLPDESDVQTITVQEAPTPGVPLYIWLAVVAVTIIIAAIAIYFLRLRKPKP